MKKQQDCSFRGCDIFRIMHEANMGMHTGTGKKAILAFSALYWAASLLNAQAALSITAASKGPNQINLTWLPVLNPGDGYLVEIQSDADNRYSSYTEMQP